MRVAPAKHVNESPALGSPVIANTSERFRGEPKRHAAVVDNQERNEVNTEASHKTNALVDPAWVAAHRDDPNVCLIEVAGLGEDDFER